MAVKIATTGSDSPPGWLDPQTGGRPVLGRRQPRPLGARPARRLPALRGRVRGGPGAIPIFKEVPGLHVSVSSVSEPRGDRSGGARALIAFLDSLGVDEAWLSEVKPTVSDFWSDDLVITEEDRRRLCRLQDVRN